MPVSPRAQCEWPVLPLVRTILKPALHLLAFIYYLGLKLHCLLYQLRLKPRTSLPGTTVSVGNLTVGGTGKSPVIIAMARHLAAKGLGPVVLTRGYRSGLSRHEFVVVLDGQIVGGDYRQGDLLKLDEAMMQSNALPGVPIIAGAQRAKAARWFLNSSLCRGSACYWLIDDGFQHWPLYRDLDVVLIDEHESAADDLLLPSGRLREPVTALQRADVVLLTRSDLPSFEPSVNAALAERFGLPWYRVSSKVGNPIQVGGPQPKRAPLEWGAVAAIARPERFLSDAVKQGLKLKKQLLARDHQAFDQAQLRNFSVGVEAILTTAKDYWREPAVFPPDVPLYILPLDVEVPHEFLDKLERVPH